MLAQVLGADVAPHVYSQEPDRASRDSVTALLFDRFPDEADRDAGGVGHGEDRLHLLGAHPSLPEVWVEEPERSASGEVGGEGRGRQAVGGRNSGALSMS